MKKLNIILIIFTLVVFSCSKDDAVTDDLQSQITKLEQQIQTLQGQVTTLQTQLTSANNSNATLTQQLAAAQVALNEAQDLITQSTTDISLLAARLAFVQDALSAIDYSSTVSLKATGNVANQTPAEAKKTIYGRWNIGSSSKLTPAGKLSCSFDFFEFNDEVYVLSLNLPDGEKGTVFGEYILTEDANGKVSSVDLMFDAGLNVVRIARLTNIVVTSNPDDTLSATFDIELTLPEALEICQASLPGSVQSVKEEPLDQATTANAVSNHAKLIGKWDLVAYSTTEGDTMASLLNEQCIIEEYNPNTGEYTEVLDPDCIPPVLLVVNFSDFGTYSIVALNEEGSPVYVDVQSWSWYNDDQTKMNVCFDQGDCNIVDVLELTETNARFSGTYYDDQQVEQTESLTFQRSQNQ